MKNISIPKEKTNRIRRYGSASNCTSGAAFTSPRSEGAATYPMGARMTNTSSTEVRNA